MRRLHFFLLWAAALALLAGCGVAETPAGVSTPFGLLRQVSDYPLYELHYQDDYGFGDYIKKGSRPSGVPAPGGLAFACSCFSAAEGADQRVFGRNFDWGLHPALLLHTDPPDGYASVAMVDLHYLGYDQAVTPLNAPEKLKMAPYLPFDGMNEHGLAVGMMAVDRAEGSKDPDKVTLDDLELIRLWLDYARDVPAAIELLGRYNVRFGNVPLHYLLADARGNSALVEFLDGRPVVLPNAAAWQVSTNFLVSLERPQGAASSCPRYNRLYASLESRAGRLQPGEAFSLLGDVSQAGANATRWSVVYHQASKTVSLVMGRQFERVFEFRVGSR